MFAASSKEISKQDALFLIKTPLNSWQLLELYGVLQRGQSAVQRVERELQLWQQQSEQ
jgi:hypothetical protein